MLLQFAPSVTETSTLIVVTSFSVDRDEDPENLS